MRLLVVGLAVGFAGALAFSRLLQSVLFNVHAVDLQIYLVVGAVLLAAAFIAAWVPARRASRVDPMRLLRDA